MIYWSLSFRRMLQPPFHFQTSLNSQVKTVRTGLNSRCKDDETAVMRVGYIVDLGCWLSCSIGPFLYIPGLELWNNSICKIFSIFFFIIVDLKNVSRKYFPVFNMLKKYQIHINQIIIFSCSCIGAALSGYWINSLFPSGNWLQSIIQWRELLKVIIQI